MAEISDEGRFCTSAEASQRFFEAIFDPSAGGVSLPVNGDFLRAAEVAHREGLRGAGRTVAVLDSGFDMTIKSLRDAALETSVTSIDTVKRRGHHGTVVALLIRWIAPDARLLLLDIGLAGTPKRSQMAAALRKAFGDNADVVNVSLEFRSRLPERAASRMESSDEAGHSQVAGTTRSLLEAAAAGFGRECLSPCAICEALADEPVGAVVVSAAGNDANADPVCPSCNVKVIGAGFERQSHVLVDGVDLIVRAHPSSFSQNYFAELSIPQPVGFDGTSFAAPLVSGMLAALSEEHERFPEMIWLPTALTPATAANNLHREMQQSGHGNDAAEVARVALAEYQAAAELCPREHQHWLPGSERACAFCAWCMTDWYRDYSALLIRTGNLEIARNVAGLGSIVNPQSPEITGNLAVACNQLADAARPGTAERDRLRSEAATHFQRTIDLGGSRELFEALLAQTLASQTADGSR